MKLSEKDKNLIRLLQRTEADESGWCRVAMPQLFELVKEMPKELVELVSKDGVNSARLTGEGKIVSKWIT